MIIRKETKRGIVRAVICLGNKRALLGPVEIEQALVLCGQIFRSRF